MSVACSNLSVCLPDMLLGEQWVPLLGWTCWSLARLQAAAHETEGTLM